MNRHLNAAVPLAGRVLLSAIFLMSGIGKIFDRSGTMGYMEAEGMPMVSLFLVLAIVFELAGGLSLLIGYKARVGAVLLILFLIPATLIFHDFWTFAEPERTMQMINFMKNLAIMGGLLMVLANGPGRISIDARNTGPGAGNA